jgi:hypothetical protein
MRLSRLIPAMAIASLAFCGTMSVLIRPATAEIVCDRDGDDCWHVDHHYDRPPPGVHFEYHPDGWYFRHDWDRDRDHHWRHERQEHRGYWRNGLWITF